MKTSHSGRDLVTVAFTRAMMHIAYEAGMAKAAELAQLQAEGKDVPSESEVAKARRVLIRDTLRAN